MRRDNSSAVRQLRRLPRRLLAQRSQVPVRRLPVLPTCRLPGVPRALLHAAVPHAAAGPRVHRRPIHRRLSPPQTRRLLSTQPRCQGTTTDHYTAIR